MIILINESWMTHVSHWLKEDPFSVRLVFNLAFLFEFCFSTLFDLEK